ncbi:MAG: DUF6573 family protein [Mangrovibacterium sp.]
MFTKKDLIFSYTTREAVRDNVLVVADRDLAEKAAIHVPVYLTRHVWERYVEVPPALAKVHSLQFRLFNILMMFVSAAMNCDDLELKFRINSLVAPELDWLSNESESALHFKFREVILKAVISARDVDDPSPAVFIMAPFED